MQQLQLSASVYTVGAILLSERLIDTKSRMVMRDDSEESARGAFQKHSFPLSAIQHVYKVKTKTALTGQGFGMGSNTKVAP